MSQLAFHIIATTTTATVVAAAYHSTDINDINDLQIVEASPYNLDIASCQMDIRLSLDSRFSLSSISEESDCEIDDVKLSCLPKPITIPLKSILLSSITRRSQLQSHHLGDIDATSNYDEAKRKNKKKFRFADDLSIINVSETMSSLRVPNKNMLNIESQFASENKKSKTITSSKKTGHLCPYCEGPLLIQLKQTYTDHMLVEHGIFSNGKKVIDPLVCHGEMQNGETLKVDKFECLTCPYDGCSHNEFITFGKMSYIKGYLSYLRHVACFHRDGRGIKPRGKNQISQRFLKSRRKEKEKKQRDNIRKSKSKNKSTKKKKKNKNRLE